MKDFAQSEIVVLVIMYTSRPKEWMEMKERKEGRY